MITTDQALQVALDVGACPDCDGKGKRGPKLSAKKFTPDGMITCETCSGTGYTPGTVDRATLDRAAAMLLPLMPEQVARWLPGAKVATGWSGAFESADCRSDYDGSVLGRIYRSAAGRWTGVVELDEEERSRPLATPDEARAWVDQRLTEAGYVLCVARWVPVEGREEAGPEAFIAPEQRCADCGGAGWYDVLGTTCHTCHGSGRVPA